MTKLTPSESAAIKNQKLSALVRQYPGLDALALKAKGWNPRTHGSLRDAEHTGLLVYRNGGWYAV